MTEAGIATTAIAFNMLAPAAFASTTVEISGNGAHSNNTANVTNNNSVNVTQNNTLNVSVNISSSANTGGNKANDNTGGDVNITTGNANSTASLNVTGGVNVANVTSCGCEDQSNDSITISGNGKKSDNKSVLNNTNKKTVNQTSKTYVSAWIKSKANTGKNKANDNTNGTVDVSTGNSDSSTMVDVSSPVNVLNP